MQNDHKMVVRSDARAMSAVTALSTRVSDRWQGSNADTRTFDGKPFTGTSNCVSYYLDDDGNKVNARLFRAAHRRKSNRIPNRYTSEQIDAINDAPVARRSSADLAPIGDSNH